MPGSRRTPRAEELEPLLGGVGWANTRLHGGFMSIRKLEEWRTSLDQVEFANLPVGRITQKPRLSTAIQHLLVDNWL